MDFNIRPARETDYDELCRLMEQVDALHREHLPHLFRKPAGPVRDRDYIVDLIQDEHVGLFVAEGSVGLLGFVHVLVRHTPPIPLFVDRRFAIVDNLGVDRNSRRAGIGRALMEQAHDWAIRKGAESVELNVYEFNDPAIAFYEKLGYEGAARRMTLPLGS
jgi:ribosomal protein S18 acetylase RimI-like enzyme